MEIRQILNLTSQDNSKKILSDFVRKDFAEFSYNFSHFQYAKCLRKALNNYSMLKLRFLIYSRTFEMRCKSASHQYYARNQDTKPHFIVELPQNRGRSMSIFFYLPQLLLLRRHFSCVHFPYEIHNIIVLSVQSLAISPNCP